MFTKSQTKEDPRMCKFEVYTQHESDCARTLMISIRSLFGVLWSIPDMMF